jgi:hypothetical protein
MLSADAMLYHDALCRAAALLGIDVALHNRGEELTRASDVLGVNRLIPDPVSPIPGSPRHPVC